MTDINQPNSDYTLKSANGLWVQKNYPIKPSYQNTLANNYLAQVTNPELYRSASTSHQYHQ